MRFRTDGRHFTAQVIAWVRSLKKSAQIALAVCLAHFSAIIWMSIDYYLSCQPQNRRPIYVRTIQPVLPMHVASAPSHEPIAASPSTTPKRAISAKPQTTPAKKLKNSSPKGGDSLTQKAASDAFKPSVPMPKKKSAPPQTIPAQSLQQIENSFAALSNSNSPKTAPSQKIQLPAPIEAKSCILASVEENSPIASAYNYSLIDHLQNSLELPEIGEVRLKISIISPGKLYAIEILDTKSRKNADWLKNQLPLLDLPCFNDFNITDPLLEFTIMFRNA